MAWAREESFETGFACNGEVVTVRVTRAGTLEMDGYDLQYDQAQMEFRGGKPSVCLDMYRGWDSSPAPMIIKHFDIPKFTLCRLALDLAEHVSWMIHQYSGSHAYIRESFDNARKLIDITEKIHQDIEEESTSKFYKQTELITHIVLVANHFANIRSSVPGVKTAGFSVLNAMHAAHLITKSTYSELQLYSRYTAVEAVEASGQHRKRGEVREQTWQIRRFIDVMSAIKHHQPWPPLKWTK